MKCKIILLSFLSVLLSNAAQASTMVPTFTSVSDCIQWTNEYANNIPTGIRYPSTNWDYKSFFKNFSYNAGSVYLTTCSDSNGNGSCIAKWYIDTHNNSLAGGCQLLGTTFWPELNSTLQTEVNNYESDPKLPTLPSYVYGVSEAYQSGQTPNINDGVLQPQLR